MSDILALASQLSDIGFPALLVIILYGSYKGWWVWGHSCASMKADFDTRLAKSEQVSDKWQGFALRGVGLAEKSVDIVKKSNGI